VASPVVWVVTVVSQVVHGVTSKIPVLSVVMNLPTIIGADLTVSPPVNITLLVQSPLVDVNKIIYII
jgi:hypothetical protein